MPLHTVDAKSSVAVQRSRLDLMAWRTSGELLVLSLPQNPEEAASSISTWAMAPGHRDLPEGVRTSWQSCFLSPCPLSWVTPQGVSIPGVGLPTVSNLTQEVPHWNTQQLPG